MKKYKNILDEEEEQVKKTQTEENFDEGLEDVDFTAEDEGLLQELFRDYNILKEKEEELKIIGEFPELQKLDKEIEDQIASLKAEFLEGTISGPNFKRLQKTIQFSIDDKTEKFIEHFKKDLETMPYEELKEIHERFQHFKVDEELERELERKPFTADQLQELLFEGEQSYIGLSGGEELREEELEAVLPRSSKHSRSWDVIISLMFNTCSLNAEY